MSIHILLLVTLFIQTEGGTVSVQKDLDAKTCKIILNTIRCRSDCMCIKVDKNGDIENLNVKSCTRMSNQSDIKLGECIE